MLPNRRSQFQITFWCLIKYTWRIGLLKRAIAKNLLWFSISVTTFGRDVKKCTMMLVVRGWISSDYWTFEKKLSSAKSSKQYLFILLHKFYVKRQLHPCMKWRITLQMKEIQEFISFLFIALSSVFLIPTYVENPRIRIKMCYILYLMTFEWYS